ncbi:UDP-GlcNAc:alpha3-D-mannoside beta-1,2-N-acetylglucosaminyltransferase I [Trypanosoma equiperdum]|uniref:Hexosyltransferase n=1 Tax=Trypanosoma equiperdum TaxID=5694 RepID=A0A1G4IDN8_TRYEQ|nr:UDP-GlcNAc:alpha3-D-mannoside beta-1,2-N-acetylglucosaminyltransferase I [Trypanosoma equiperdum]
MAIKSRGVKVVIIVFIAVYVLTITNVLISLHRFHQNSQKEVVKIQRDEPLPDFEYTEDDKMALEFVTPHIIKKWRNHNYLVALGIPSPDNEERRRRRQLQRDTCWKYPGVATVENNFEGDMLVAYVLARHPQFDYKYSPELKDEANKWRDVITLPINEGRVTTKKKLGEVAHWGIDAEIGMSRKIYLWFELGARLLPKTSYFSKGDDDAFFHSPQYITDLRTLPRRGVYWAFHWRINPVRPFIFGRGLLYTMSRDVVNKFVTYEPVRRLVHVPFSFDRLLEFKQSIMEYEDAMVGHALSYQNPEELLFVNESCCRFIILNGNECKPPKNNNFVVVHGIQEEEYAIMMERFKNYTTPVPVQFIPSKYGWMANCTLPPDPQRRRDAEWTA